MAVARDPQNIYCCLLYIRSFFPLYNTDIECEKLKAFPILAYIVQPANQQIEYGVYLISAKSFRDYHVYHFRFMLPLFSLSTCTITHKACDTMLLKASMLWTWGCCQRGERVWFDVSWVSCYRESCMSSVMRTVICLSLGKVELFSVQSCFSSLFFCSFAENGGQLE